MSGLKLYFDTFMRKHVGILKTLTQFNISDASGAVCENF